MTVPPPVPGLVERLRDYPKGMSWSDCVELFEEAAAEITRLTAPLAGELDLETTRKQRDGLRGMIEGTDPDATGKVRNGFLLKLVNDADKADSLRTALAASEGRAVEAQIAYDALLATWAESRERHLEAEARAERAEAALRDISNTVLTSPKDKTT